MLITILSVLLWGPGVFPQIALSGLGNILLILIVIILQKMKLPFTQARDMQQKGTNSIAAIFSMLLMLLLAGLIYLTISISVWITFLICGVAAGLIVLMFTIIRKRAYWISG
jgi:hypothetical protein